MMFKKILVLLLSVSLLVTVVGCSKGNGGTDKDNTKGNTGKSEPYTLTIAWPVYGDTPQDLNKVAEKASEITLKKLNIKLEIKPVSLTAMANTYSLAVSSSEKLDLISLCPTVSTVQYAQDKMIMPLDDLVAKYGSNIKTGLGDVLKSGQINGKQYVIPTKDTITYGNGIVMLKSIVDKYHIDVTKIKTLDDLDAVFAKVHAGEPDMTVFFPYGVSGFLGNFDGQPVGLLNNGLDNTTYTNVFASDEFKVLVKKMREWYNKGYISKDFATVQSSYYQLMEAGKLFASCNNTTDLNLSMGDPVAKVEVTLNDPIQRGSGGGAFSWAIPITAKHPEKSMQFLNLVFKDKDLVNLLAYGIEGVHYTKNSDGTVDTSKNTTYNVQPNIWGNPDMYYINQHDLVGSGGSLEKYKENKAAWDKKVKTAKDYGFTFDSSPVKNETASVTAVTDQYDKLLEGGALDPDVYVKKMNDALKAAGIQKIIDEEQKQYNEWSKKHQ